MEAVWTIEVGGSAKPYKKITLNRSLENDSPTQFNAQVRYDGQINFFDLVEIKRNGTVEWKGFVEGIEIEWGEDGRYYNIYGRNTDLILWKKFNEDFTQGIYEDGFFGNVNAMELTKFLLRTPKSDSISEYPYNKEGWGMDSSRIFECKAYRTSVGDPNFVRLRKKLGMGWRNTGSPFKTGTLAVDGIIGDVTWTTTGASPYLDDDTDNYISSVTSGDVGVFTFENLGDVGAIKKVILSFKWKADQYWWDWWSHGKFYVYIWVGSDNRWVKICEVEGRNTGWLTWSYDISDEIKTTLDLANCKVKFINMSDKIKSYICKAYLTVAYSTGGTQDVNDYFAVSIDKETTMGIYIESRLDNDSYPRNYEIVNIKDDVEGYEDYTEVDPNNHISLDYTNTTIDFDSYQNETAYLYKDYGIDGIKNFEWRWKFKIVSSKPHYHCFEFFTIANTLKDRRALEYDGDYFFGAGLVNEADVIKIRGALRDSSGLGYSSSSDPISLDTYYYVKIRRFGNKIYVDVYTDSSFETLFWNETFTITGTLYFRYRFHAITWNGLDFALWFSDSFENTLNNWTRNGGTAIDSFSQITVLHGTYSWKIVATTEQYKRYVEKELDESSEVRTDWHVYLPTPNSESVNTNLIVNAWEFAHQDWTHVNTEPWLHNDDENDYIHLGATDENVGKYDEAYAFGNLNSKYEAITPSLERIYLKAKLYDGTEGHADSVNIKVYVWDGSQWWDLGSAVCSSTVWENLIYENSGATPLRNILDTVAKINGAKIKIELSYVTGGGQYKGGVKITYAYLHIEGVAYWGRIKNLAKVFDKDVAGIDDPSTNFHGMAGVYITDAGGNPNKWKYYITGWDNSGLWSHFTTETASSNTWLHLRLYVKEHETDGYVKLYLVQGTTEYLKAEATGLANNSKGTPDCVDVGCNFSNNAFGTIYIDFAQIYTKAISHTHGYITDLTNEEEVLAAVNNNTFRDIIHSWSPKEVSNLKIRITAYDAHPWAISQIYIYKAEDVDYRVLISADESPSYSSSQYIHAVNVIDNYSVPIGPLNVPRGRLLDTINSIVKMCHSNYIPYRWWLSMDANNTFNIGVRKGSDKSATISFVLGTNLEGSTRTMDIDESAQRIKIMGRGEGRRQEIISSDWKMDINEMANINGWYEEIISGKTVTNKDVANLLGEIELKDKAPKKDQLVSSISRDTYTSMAYDVGDDVSVTDGLVEYSTATTLRIFNIRKSIDENGEQITIYYGEPYKDVADEWGEIYRRIKDLELSSAITGGLYGSGTQSDRIDVTKTTDFFEKTAKNDEVTDETPQKDPAWYLLVNGLNPNNITYTNASGAPEYQPEKAVMDMGLEWLKSNDWMAVKGTNNQTSTTKFEIELRGDKANGEEISIYMRQNPKLVAEIKVFEILTGDVQYWTIGDYFDMGFGRHGVTEKFCFRVKCVGNQLFKIYARWYAKGEWNECEIRDIDHNTKYRIEIVTEYERKMVLFNVYEPDDETPVTVVGYDISDVSLRPLYMGITSTHPEAGKRAVIYIYKFRTEWEV